MDSGLYKIKSICHSGRLEARGEHRIDGRYPKRIGRIVRGLDAEVVDA